MSACVFAAFTFAAATLEALDGLPRFLFNGAVGTGPLARTRRTRIDREPDGRATARADAVETFGGLPLFFFIGVSGSGDRIARIEDFEIGGGVAGEGVPIVVFFFGRPRPRFV